MQTVLGEFDFLHEEDRYAKVGEDKSETADERPKAESPQPIIEFPDDEVDLKKYKKKKIKKAGNYKQSSFCMANFIIFAFYQDLQKDFLCIVLCPNIKAYFYNSSIG